MKTSRLFRGCLFLIIGVPLIAFLIFMALQSWQDFERKSGSDVPAVGAVEPEAPEVAPGKSEAEPEAQPEAVATGERDAEPAATATEAEQPKPRIERDANGKVTIRQ